MSSRDSFCSSALAAKAGKAQPDQLPLPELCDARSQGSVSAARQPFLEVDHPILHSKCINTDLRHRNDNSGHHHHSYTPQNVDLPTACTMTAIRVMPNTGMVRKG